MPSEISDPHGNEDANLRAMFVVAGAVDAIMSHVYQFPFCTMSASETALIAGCAEDVAEAVLGSLQTRGWLIQVRRDGYRLHSMHSHRRRCNS